MNALPNVSTVHCACGWEITGDFHYSFLGRLKAHQRGCWLIEAMRKELARPLVFPPPGQEDRK